MPFIHKIFCRLFPDLFTLLGKISMMHKILSIGMILFFSVSCMPSMRFLSEKNRTEFLSITETQSSLFTQAELDELLSNETTPSQMEISTPSSSLLMNGLSHESLELPIRDESNDDFSVEGLYGIKKVGFARRSASAHALGR